MRFFTCLLVFVLCLTTAVYGSDNKKLVKSRSTSSVTSQLLNNSNTTNSSSNDEYAEAIAFFNKVDTHGKSKEQKEAIKRHVATIHPFRLVTHVLLNCEPAKTVKWLKYFIDRWDYEHQGDVNAYLAAILFKVYVEGSVRKAILKDVLGKELYGVACREEPLAFLSRHYDLFLNMDTDDLSSFDKRIYHYGNALLAAINTKHPGAGLEIMKVCGYVSRECIKDPSLCWGDDEKLRSKLHQFFFYSKVKEAFPDLYKQLGGNDSATAYSLRQFLLDRTQSDDNADGMKRSKSEEHIQPTGFKKSNPDTTGTRGADFLSGSHKKRRQDDPSDEDDSE